MPIEYTPNTDDKYPYPRVFCDGTITDGHGNQMKTGFITNSNTKGEVDVKYLEEIRNLKLSKNQVLLATYPRSGTTCSQFFISAMLNDFKDAEMISNLEQNGQIFKFSPFIEATNEKFGSSCSLKYCQEKLSRDENFVIKCHYPRWLNIKDLKSCKTLICVRNPADQMLSWYRMMMNFPDDRFQDGNFKKMDIQTFAKMTMEGHVAYGSWLSWHESWVEEAKNNPNCFVYFYEDICQYPRKVITDIAKFLEVELDESKVKTLIEILDYDKAMSRRKNGSEKRVPGGKKIGSARQYLGEDLWETLKKHASEIDPIFKVRFE